MCEHLSRWKSLKQQKSPFYRVQRACLAVWKACNASTPPSGFACLTCGSCTGSTTKCRLHAGNTGHCLVLDIGTTQIYCTCCSDYIYDSQFDEAILGAAAAAGREALDTFETSKPLPRAVQNLHDSSEQDLRRRLSGGLRGIVNLGNTCFMGSVLQALLHAPPLRDFYLGGGHPHAGCTSINQKSCLSCELHGVFSEAYSGLRTPLCPANFLTCWWQHTDALAGYQQQDAHEFYLFLLSVLETSKIAAPSPAASPASGMKQDSDPLLELSGIRADESALPPHSHEALEAVLEPKPMEEEKLPPLDRQPSPAARTSTSSAESEESIVERALGGLLRSDVSCLACGYTSTVYEPFLDLPLDIQALPSLPPPLLKPQQQQTQQTQAQQQAQPHFPVSKNGKRLVGAAATAALKAAAKLSSRSSLPANAAGVPAEEGQTAEVARSALQSTPAASSEATAPPVPAAFPGAVAVEPSGQQSKEQSENDIPPEGAHSNLLEASARITTSTEGYSSVGAVSAVVQQGAASREGSLSSPLQKPASSTLQVAAAIAPVVGVKRPAPKAARPPSKRPKVARCGECHTCRHKHLKKACLRNARLKQQADESVNARLATEHLLASYDRLDGLQPSPWGTAKDFLGPDSQAVASEPVNGTPALPQDASLCGQGSNSEAAQAIVSPTASAPGLPTQLPAMRRPKSTSKGKSRHSNANGWAEWADGAAHSIADGLTLHGCLRRYTRPERLGGKWLCDRCKERQGVKQVSVRRLPRILCLHLKRFQHSGMLGSGKKVTTPVRYPAHLDMQPFLSSAVLKKRLGLHQSSLPTFSRSSPGAVYELYAIICHKGNLQGGHYIAYVRSGHRWFSCDDSFVYEVTEATALLSQAYMLFYRTLSQ